MKIRAIFVSTALLFACPANASTYLTTYTGTVLGANDELGIFGAPGTYLDGLEFTAVFELTWPLAGAHFISNPNSSYIGGGLGSGPGVPSPVSGKLTINGLTVNFSGSYQGYGVITDYSSINNNDSLDYYLESRENNLQTYLDAGVDSSTNFVNLADLTNPLSYTMGPNDYSTGSWGIYDPNDLAAPRSVGFLRFSSVTVSPLASAVPEPATWATMLLGFGLIGGAMRYRRRPQVSVRFV